MYMKGRADKKAVASLVGEENTLGLASVVGPKLTVPTGFEYIIDLIRTNLK
jgi:hypothetical protein